MTLSTHLQTRRRSPIYRCTKDMPVHFRDAHISVSPKSAWLVIGERFTESTTREEWRQNQQRSRLSSAETRFDISESNTAAKPIRHIRPVILQINPMAGTRLCSNPVRQFPALKRAQWDQEGHRSWTYSLCDTFIITSTSPAWLQ